MPPLNREEAIRLIPFLKGLGPDQVKSIAAQAQEIHLQPDEVLFVVGEPCQGLYVVSSGSVKVTRISSEGREQVMTIVRAGETLNEVPVFDGGDCPATVVAVHKTVVFMVPADTVRKLVRTVPEMAAQALQVFAARLRGLINLTADLTHLDVPTRVARALITYSQQSGLAELTVNQSDLAAIVGTTREGVARALKRLEDAGAVTRQRGTVEIIDESILRKIAEV